MEFRRGLAIWRDVEDVFVEPVARSTATAAATTMRPTTAVNRRQLIWIPLLFRVARFVERAISLKPAGECQGRMRLCTRAGPSIAFALPRAGRRERAHDRTEDVGCLGRSRR